MIKDQLIYFEKKLEETVEKLDVIIFISGILPGAKLDRL